MTGRRWGLVALGGVAGAAVRWATLEAWPVDGGFPWPVLVLNVIGSLVVGATMGDGAGGSTRATASVPRPPVLIDLVGLGFCGGLTTFSTFAVEVVTLDRAGDAGAAGAYVIASIVGAVVAVPVGAGTVRAARRTTAVDPPDGGPA
jgi:CrcB protein